MTAAVLPEYMDAAADILRHRRIDRISPDRDMLDRTAFSRRVQHRYFRQLPSGKETVQRKTDQRTLRHFGLQWGRPVITQCNNHLRIAGARMHHSLEIGGKR